MPRSLPGQVYLIGKGADVEVKIEKDGKMHKADARMKSGLIVELQHSHLSVDEIEEREAFYGKMVWVFDARLAFSRDRIDLRPGDNRHVSLEASKEVHSVRKSPRPPRSRRRKDFPTKKDVS